MITVKCGYEGCGWSKSENAPDYRPYTKMSSIMQTMYDVALGMAAQKLLSHQVDAHNVPPAIWER